MIVNSENPMASEVDSALMPKAKIQSIVRFLRFSGDEPRLPASFSAGNLRVWGRVLDWLDSSGLSLYFLQRLRSRGMTDAVPAHVLFQLEQRQQANRQRISRMKRTFELVNRLFCDAGVEYAVLKGFSLVPEYCPDASLRAQSDLDYLIAASSLDRARQILTEQGYVLRRQTGEEFAFWIPSAEPSTYSAQYDPEAPFMIELHGAVWDHGINEVPTAMRSISFVRMTLREWDGAVFHALPDGEIFLGQILHAFRHFMLGDVRPSWLFEIGFFLKNHREDSAFWSEIERLVQSNAMTGEIVRIITGLVATLFDPTRSAVPLWFEQMSPTTRQWLNTYGRNLVLEGCPGYGPRLLPKTKLLIFLMEQYIPDGQSRLGLRWRSLLPVPGLRALAKPPKKPDSTLLKIVAEKSSWLASRLVYHAGANLRYLLELPRWRRMNRRRPARHPALGSA